MNVTKQALNTGIAVNGMLVVQAKTFCFEDAVLASPKFWDKVKAETGVQGSELKLPTSESYAAAIDLAGVDASDPELIYGTERLANALNTAREMGASELVLKLH